MKEARSLQRVPGLFFILVLDLEGIDKLLHHSYVVQRTFHLNQSLYFLSLIPK